MRLLKAPSWGTACFRRRTNIAQNCLALPQSSRNSPGILPNPITLKITRWKAAAPARNWNARFGIKSLGLPGHVAVTAAPCGTSVRPPSPTAVLPRPFPWVRRPLAGKLLAIEAKPHHRRSR
jgi:hypothetical protein